jgi:hypothetical protein
MDGDRVERAIARIEAASRRIEAVASRPAASVVSTTGEPELESKYQHLRRETGAALAELDRLIGSLEA